ncbi:hypothetical protein I603_2575 [Erythrobacter dokdonensis DSW-74]|uniref:Uncharacterized protein n=1 Tax=Erythrobacter dokdonensis DSW-74 TaxID=1300349 RepID=A0A1A7BBZ0_9SPHN|nr:hypothetical protein I603_2575 [Erythrobacter dokdonensis DSW-74]
MAIPSLLPGFSVGPSPPRPGRAQNYRGARQKQAAGDVSRAGSVSLSHLHK